MYNSRDSRLVRLTVATCSRLMGDRFTGLRALGRSLMTRSAP